MRKFLKKCEALTRENVLNFEQAYTSLNDVYIRMLHTMAL